MSETSNPEGWMMCWECLVPLFPQLGCLGRAPSLSISHCIPIQHISCSQQMFTPYPCGSHFYSRFVQSLFLCFICHNTTLIPAVLVNHWESGSP